MSNIISLNDIVNVEVTISPSSVYRKTFDSALILGTSDIITTSDRVKEFADLNAMKAGGFLESSPEYKAAALYFGQQYKPRNVFVGRMDKAAEKLVDAITACRVKNSEWYVCVLTNETIELPADEQDVFNAATYIESATPASMLAITLISDNDGANLAISLKNAKFNRTMVMFDGVKDTTGVNDGKSIVAAIIGYAMGKNKKLADSFVLAYKSLSGVLTINSSTAMPIDENGMKELFSLNANAYVSQGGAYDLFRQGKMIGGQYFDEVLYLDMLVNELRMSIMDTLVSVPKIGQTIDGINNLTNSISVAMDKYVGVKFIQPGVWLGSDILALKTGDMLNQGYLIQFDDINSQSASDRAARIAPNCYIAAKLSGAIEFVVLGLQVSR